VGGGVIGMAVALELAVSGRECVLVDPAPGRGASWAAGGMLSPAAEVAPGEEPLLADLTAAAAMWPDFARRLEELSGIDIDYVACGSILVGITRSDVRETARLAHQIIDAGHVARALHADELATLEPTLTASAGGWLLPDDHCVDNRLVLEALVAGLKAVGVSILEDRCERLDAQPGGIRVSLAHLGDVVAAQCVLATGAAEPLAGTEGLGARAVRPVRGLTLRLSAQPGTALPTRTVRAVLDGVHCYLVPRSGPSIVVGATSEEQGDPRVARAGGVYQLLDASRRVLPIIDELHLEEVAVGLRPATADHLPFVAPLADPRVVAALGHYRNGVLLAPMAAAKVAQLLSEVR
jgi:glycine oxidase